MGWSNTDGEYEFNNREDWARFEKECRDLHAKGLTILEIVKETGGDYSDVRHAIETEGR